MSTVFIRIENVEEGTSDKYLISCAASQESILKTANRKDTVDNPAALFIAVFCSILPDSPSLSNRKAAVDKALAFIQNGIKMQKYPGLSASTVTKALGYSSKFFGAPYGIFKVLKSPLSLLDPSSEYRVSNVLINSTLDLLAVKTANF